MWISRATLDNLYSRIGDLERKSYTGEHLLKQTTGETVELRNELRYLRDQLRVLIDSLGLVHRQTPSKEEYVKKGGPERG